MLGDERGRVGTRRKVGGEGQGGDRYGTRVDENLNKRTRSRIRTHTHIHTHSHKTHTHTHAHANG